MAAITKADLRNRLLSHIGVLGAGGTPSADDASIVDDAIDAAHNELRKLGLANFATSSIPEWAQNGLMYYVEVDVKPHFGIPVPNPEAERAMAERRLERQVAGFKHALRIKSDYF